MPLPRIDFLATAWGLHDFGGFQEQLSTEWNEAANWREERRKITNDLLDHGLLRDFSLQNGCAAALARCLLNDDHVRASVDECSRVRARIAFERAKGNMLSGDEIDEHAFKGHASPGPDRLDPLVKNLVKFSLASSTGRIMFAWPGATQTLVCEIPRNDSTLSIAPILGATLDRGFILKPSSARAVRISETLACLDDDSKLRAKSDRASQVIWPLANVRALGARQIHPVWLTKCPNNPERGVLAYVGPRSSQGCAYVGTDRFLQRNGYNLFNEMFPLLKETNAYVDGHPVYLFGADDLPEVVLRNLTVLEWLVLLGLDPDVVGRFLLAPTSRFKNA